MLKKILNIIKEPFKKDINAIFTIVILIFCNIVIYAFAILTLNPSTNQIFKNSIGTLGVLFIAPIVIILLYYILVRPKVRLLSLIFTSVIVIYFGGMVLSVVFAFFALIFAGTSGPSRGLNIELPDFLLTFFQGNLAGAFFTLSVYIILSKLNKIIPILIPFIAIIAASFWFNISGKIEPHIVIIYAITIVGMIIIAGFYYVKRYSITRKDALKKVNLKNISIFLGVLIISFIFGILLFNIMKDNVQKINDIAKEQQDQKLEQTKVNQNRDQQDVVFDRRNINPEPQIVGYYQAKKPEYLKIENFFIYQGTTLHVSTKSGNYTYYDKYNDANYSSNEADKIRIIYQSNSSSSLPSTEKIIKFDQEYYAKELGLLKNYRDITKYLDYSYTTFDYEKWKTGKYKANVDNSVYVTFDKSSTYTQIKDLTLEITKNGNDDYTKANLIKQYLINNYKYSFTPGISDVEDPIYEFLFVTKKGYCTHFATAMNLMLSTIGVKSRMAGGFYSDTYNKNVEGYMMLSNDLHAWVEVYLNGFGWTIFDPTTYNLASDTDVSLLTGANRKLAGYSPEEIEKKLTPITPDVKFNDLFIKKLNLPSSTNFDFKDAKDTWDKSFTDKTNNDTKQQSEQTKKEEKLKEVTKIEKQNVEFVFNIIMIVIAVSLVISAIGFGIYYYYLRQKNKGYYKRQSDIKAMKNLDRIIKEKYIKHYELGDEVKNMSPKDFLKRIDGLDNFENIQKIYNVIDKVLYSQNYTDEDISLAKELTSQLKLSEL